MEQAKPDLPKRIIYELLSQCNYRCIHCFVEHTNQMPSKEDIVKIMTKAISEGVPGIVWTGGEPFLRKDIFEIMETLPSKDTFHVINTNGSLLNDEKLKLTARYFSLMRLSVIGNLNNYRINSGIPNSIGYDRALKVIKNVIDHNIPLQVNIPAITKNGEDLEYIIKDLNSKFGNNLQEVVVLPIIKVGAIKESNGHFPDNNLLQSIFSDLQDKVRFPLRLLTWKPGKLMLIKSDNLAYAHPAGTGALLMGDPLKENISTIWKRFPEEFKNAHNVLTRNTVK